MRMYIIAALLAAIVVMVLFASKYPTREEVSWQSFCKHHGCDINNQSDSIYNLYLDTWCGSAAEEEALIKAGFNI